MFTRHMNMGDWIPIRRPMASRHIIQRITNR
jgi:hypothetical protein